MDSNSHNRLKSKTDDEEEVILENTMHGISLDGDEEKGMGAVPPGVVFGDPKSNPMWKRDRLNEVDRILSSDTTLLGRVRWCTVNGIYYTILRGTNLIIFCNIAMLANLTFIGTYERSKDLNYAFAIGVTVPCVFGFAVALFEYARTVRSEIRYYFDRLTVKFISPADLNCCDVSIFTIHILLFTCLLISCIAIGVKCDTPGTPCHDLYARLTGGTV